MSANYDLVIVGSGPIGSTYARILTDRAPAARILMLEAGPRLTGVPGANTRNQTDTAQRARRQHALLRSLEVAPWSPASAPERPPRP